MSKQSGLGDRLFVAGVDVSGDIGSLGRIGGGPNLLDLTGIDKSAHERKGGVLDGGIDFSAFFNDAAEQEHEILSSLPTGSRIVTYCRGAAVGNPAASCRSKQVNYDPTRGADGALTIAVQTLSDQFGLEWGELLTAGIRTDTGATDGASIDTGASADFGLQAYLHVFDFTGTDATIHIEDSADDSAWADVTDGAFTEVATLLGGADYAAERIETGRTATIRRYVRVATSTSAGFSDLDFAVVVVKNDAELNL